MDGVVILGAGLAGLGCARALPGSRVFEASDHPGGHAYSHPVDGVHFDEGAHIVHSKDPEWLDLLYHQVDNVIRTRRSNASNYWHGHWVTYPVQNHLHELPLEIKTAALTDFVAAQTKGDEREPENYHQWCLRQYGAYLTRNFYEEYTAKYWRVPMEELATDWLTGRLLHSQVKRIVAGALAEQEENQSTFTRFHYPEKDGFFKFFKPLYTDVNIRLNARATLIDPVKKIVQFEDGRQETYQALASSIPLPKLVGMLPGVPPQIKAAALHLRHTQLLCVNMIVARESLSNHHWFYIYDRDIEVSRASVINNLSPGSVLPGRMALQAEIFRRNDEPMDLEALVPKAVLEMSRILNFDPQSELVKAVPVHVPYAYIISDLNRAPAVATITHWLKECDIFLMGLFGRWKFIWSDEAYKSGRAVAKQIRTRLGNN